MVRQARDALRCGGPQTDAAASITNSWCQAGPRITHCLAFSTADKPTKYSPPSCPVCNGVVGMYCCGMVMCRRYRQDTASARRGSAQQGAAGAAPQPVQQQPAQQQLQQPQQPLLQGCSRLKLQLPLPVASAAPPGEVQPFC